MNPNSAAIAVVLDRSGSMGLCAEATISGFNQTLKDQLAEPGEASMTVVTFNDSVEIVQSLAPLAKIKFLTEKNYVPEGGTALLDAIGVTIDHVGEKLAAMAEKDRPAKVLVIIMTDGQENASKKYKKAKIAEMVSHQREKYGWEFAFLGADLSAVEDAVQSLGVTRGMASSYTASSAGTAQAHRLVSKGVSSYRSGKSYTGKP